MNDINPPQLNEAEPLYCEKNISYEEMGDVISNMKQNKSPGPDGLTPEFYKAVFEHIKTHFKAMLEETFVFGDLPTTAKQAIMTLIFKKGDKLNCGNYRGISVMDTLAKTYDKYEHNKISTKSCQNGNNRRIISALVTKTVGTQYSL